MFIPLIRALFSGAPGRISADHLLIATYTTPAYRAGIVPRLQAQERQRPRPWRMWPGSRAKVKRPRRAA